MGRVGLIKDTYWIDFILQDLAYDDDHSTSKDFSNHPKRYPFPFQAINTFKSMIAFFFREMFVTFQRKLLN